MPPAKPTDLARHPIGVVVERTGISSHVLRAWERRYDVVRPARGDREGRLYSDADIERLTLLRRAVGGGRPLKATAALTNPELRKLIEEDAARAGERPTRAGPFREQAMETVKAIAPEGLEAVLRRAALSLGALPFLEDVVAPLLEEIGDAWHDGRLSIAHEHAASAAMQQALGGLMRSLEPSGAGPRVLLATPRGEAHAFGAMAAGAAAAHDGWRVTWLGTDLPAEQIAAGAASADVRVVGVGVANTDGGLAEEVAALRASLPADVPLIVGGAGAARAARPTGVTAARDLTHWRALLRLHAPPRAS